MELNERSFREWFILLLGALAAIEVGSVVVTWSTPDLAILGAIIATVAWILWAGDNWWIPVLIGVTVGGTFIFSFKIFPSDIGLLMATIGLAPMLVLGHMNINQGHRRYLVPAFYILPAFIVARVLVSMHGSSGGAGNMARVATNALWPFAFGLLFYTYGKTSVIPRMVGAILCFTSFRVGAVYLGLILGTIIYIPGVNYVLTMDASSGQDIRGCAYFLVINFLLIFQVARNIFLKLLLIPLTVAATYLVLLGGGRFETATFPLLILAFAVATRRWALFGLTIVMAGTIFFSINVFSSYLYRLPATANRALSILVIQKGKTDTQADLEGSDLWHHALQAEGFHRWTSSPETFFFGANLKPYQADAYYQLGQAQEMNIRVSASADLGYYESGLWTVLGTLGIVGYILYLLIFISLWRYTIPYLMRHPVRTLKDGIVFWGTFSSLFWYATASAAGGFPSMELALMILAAAVVQDSSQAKSAALSEQKSPRDFRPALLTSAR